MAAHTVHTIGILAYPGAQAAAVHGLTDLFETTNRLSTTPELGTPRRRSRTAPPTVRIEITTITVDELRSMPHRMKPAAPLTALVLPPSLGHGLPDERSRPLAAWIRDRHREGTVVCSACVGGFLLAETGLLAGRPATTHWALRDAFAARYPSVLLDVDRLVIDDGDVITAGGVMAWVDLGLRLIERLLGPAMVGRIARYFVVDPVRREQRFYRSFAPPLLHGDAAILKAQHWANAHARDKLSQPQLARLAGLGERTFLRRFIKATALTPTEYLQQLRVGRARELLELTTLSVGEIADRVGYVDPGAFRKIFARVVGLTPGAYRRRFALGDRAQPHVNAAATRGRRASS